MIKFLVQQQNVSAFYEFVAYEFLQHRPLDMRKTQLDIHDRHWFLHLTLQVSIGMVNQETGISLLRVDNLFYKMLFFNSCSYFNMYNSKASNLKTNYNSNYKTNNCSIRLQDCCNLLLGAEWIIKWNKIFKFSYKYSKLDKNASLYQKHHGKNIENH